VRLPSKAVESFAGAAPSARSGASINFGPYADVAPWAGGQLRVHFENNSPFVEATSLMREIQVSHWGNVYVEEWYTVKHVGATQAVRALLGTSVPARNCCTGTQ
jgi:oligosaccharyltransferase complex subunit alpha (ribophorin I)